jgi:glucose-1-phosphatase
VTDTTPARRAEQATYGAPVEVVLFDIGGVLADFAGLPVLRELTGADSELDVAARWLLSPWVRRFESRNCSPEEFATGVVSEWNLSYEPDEFIEVFVGWLGNTPFDGADQLVRDAHAHARVGCLSNTNIVHWTRVISKWPLTELFEYRLMSFELGAVKPDAELFDRALERLPVAPDRVLFIDDNAVNVDAARAAGLRSEQTRGVDEARAALRRHAVLS